MLLPGLDGTGDNFRFLQAALDGDENAVIIGYPTDRVLTFEALIAHITDRLPPGPFLLIAESFSGPAGITVAGQSPQGCVGLALVATFRRFPLPVPLTLTGWLAPVLLALPPPKFVVRQLLAGPNAEDAVVDGLITSMAANKSGVAASRLRLLTQVDAGPALAQITVPILYLQAARDRTVPAHNLRDLQAIRRDLTVEVIDTAHLVLQREAGLALERIRGWWSTL